MSTVEPIAVDDMNRTFPTQCLRILKETLLWPVMKLIWALYAGCILVVLPLIVKTQKAGTLPPPPFILAVTHVGNFDPLFVVRSSGHYRMKALYQVDGPYPIVRFLYKAFWRFRVSQQPKLKPILNNRTMREVVAHLKRGGTLMIFPEGYWNWAKKLYPGVAVLAHRAGIPVVPVGIEHGDVFKPELDHQSPLKAVKRAIKDYRLLGYVTVHFGNPIYPDAGQEERNDVERLGRLIEARFGKFYQQFYNTSGPVWVG